MLTEDITLKNVAVLSSSFFNVKVESLIFQWVQHLIYIKYHHFFAK